MTPRMTMLLLAAAVALHGAGCAAITPSRGGGETTFAGDRRIDPRDIAVPAGYRVEAVATGLNMPTSVTFDADNRPYVTEAGYSYGEVFAEPRLLRVDDDGGGGRATPVATGDKQFAPWTGVQFHRGAFYVAEGGELGGGRISRIDAADGRLTPLVANLPTRGDHHTNGPAISADGFLYFGVGTATNSGIVGVDNYEFGWLKRDRDFHDIPARDVKLAGVNITTENPLTPGDDSDEATTGAYVPFGTKTLAGQTIKGAMPCNGAVLRIPLDSAAGRADAPSRSASQPQLVAWGVRNPYALAFESPGPDGGSGRLLVVDNMYDVRGSRPVWGAGDLLRAIDVSAEPLWHGWPDFHGENPLTWDDHYQPPGLGKPKPSFVLAEHPNPPPRPAAKLGVHAGAAGLDVSRSQGFGHAGEAFVALFGDMAPKVGKVEEPVGYQVVRVNPQTGVIEAFAVNRGKRNGPASKLKHGGLERPIAARFDRTGDALYVVDFGVMTVDKNGPKPRPNTGVLWRITRTEAGR